MNVLGFLLLVALPAASPESRWEWWPELDVYVGAGDRLRVNALAATARNRDEDFGEGALGIHVDFFAKPFARPWLLHAPDVVRRHQLTLRAGYRYGWDLEGDSGYREHRAVLEATLRFRPVLGFVLADRNRLDLRDVDGEGSWRYRNRVRLERDVPLGPRAATPYAMAEIFYDSHYGAWSRRRYSVGVEWPVGSRAVLDSSYCRQDDSRAALAHVHAVGLALNLYF